MLNRSKPFQNSPSSTSNRVVIDARMVGEIPHGISRYVSQIAAGLHSIQSLPYEVIFLTQPNLPNQLKQSIFGSFQTFPLQSPFLHPKEQLEIPRALKDLRASLYHSPSFSSLLNCPCRTMITVHDLNHLHYGSFLKKLYYSQVLRPFLKKTQAILTVSQFSQSEIAQWLNCTPSTISISYNAVDAFQSPLNRDEELRILKKFNLTPQEYFFTLSNLKPHKNLPLLIKAYQNFASQQKNAWPLVLSTPLQEQHPGVRCIGSLNDLEAKVILKHASGMYFPSLYEGFGLPPVEAALEGVPLLVSQIPPHAEGLSELDPHEIHWISPRDLHGWTQAFHRNFRGEIAGTSIKSRQRTLEKFSVERLSTTLDQIYRRVLEIES